MNQKRCRSCPHLDFNEMTDEMYCKLTDYKQIRLRWHKHRPDWCPLVGDKRVMAIDSTYNDVLNDEIKYYWIGHTEQFGLTRVCTDTLENAIEYAKRDQPNYRPFYIIKAVTHFEIVGIVNKRGKFQNRTL